MLKYSIGLDISAKDIHCCLSVIDKFQKVTVKSTRKVSNSKSGFRSLKDWMARLHKDKSVPLVACMEATGVYYENCALSLFKDGFNVSVILPNKAKKYMQASGQKSKNDSIDAKGLAQMGAEKALGAWCPMGEYFYQLRELTRHNQGLCETKTMICNRLSASELGMYQNKGVIKQTKQLIALLDKQLCASAEQISRHIGSDPEVARKVTDICQMKGLRVKTVATVLAETNGFLLFNNSRQLVSFSGYDTVENQSGNHIGRTRISKKGNSHIRRILYMPALVVVSRKVKPFIELYNRIFARSGIKMKGYVAVQKKLLIIIYALWKKNTPFEENYSGYPIQLQEIDHILGTEALPCHLEKGSAGKPGTTQGKLNYRMFASS